MAIKPPSTHPNATSTPQALTFPAQTFAKLSPSAYLTAHLTSPYGLSRPDGRVHSESRTPTVHTGSLAHSHGSAVVRCGDTAVVCGIRGEILKVEDVADWESICRNRENTDTESETTAEREQYTLTEEEKKQQRRKQDASELANLHLLIPNLSLETGCSPSHLPGGPPSPLAQTLTQRIHTLLHKSHLLNIDDLRIWSQPPTTPTTAERQGEGEAEELEAMAKPETKAHWTLYIDILFISLSGNPFDAAWFALLAALRNVRLPRAWYDSDAQSVLCSPLPSETKALTLYDTPVALSWGLFHGEGDGEGARWLLADPDGFEEGLCREVGTVVVGAGGRVVRVEKSGGGAVGRREVERLVGLARERREEWLRVWGGG